MNTNNTPETPNDKGVLEVTKTVDDLDAQPVAMDEETMARRKRKAEVAKVIIAMVLVGVFGFVSSYVYNEYKDSDKSEVATVTPPPSDAMFLQPENSVTPLPPPAPAPVQETPPPPPVSEPLPAPHPPPPTTKPVVKKVIYPQVYTNPEFGVEVTMPNIVATQAENTTVALYNGATVELYGYIEKYASEGMDMGTLYKQLRASPNVTNLYETQIAGRQAFVYNTNEGSNAAILINGTVYYIHGQLATADNLSKLKFL